MRSADADLFDRAAETIVGLLGTNRGMDICALTAALWKPLGEEEEGQIQAALERDRDRLLHSNGSLFERLQSSLCDNWSAGLSKLCRTTGSSDPVTTLIEQALKLMNSAEAINTTKGWTPVGNLGSVLFSADDLETRVRQLGKRISDDYQGLELTLVGVMKSAVTFTVDLARAIDIPLAIDWISVSSYGMGVTSAGEIKFRKDLDNPIAGRHVLVVDDVLATGVTLSWLFDHLHQRAPASVAACTLIRVPGYQTEDVDVRYIGFDAKADWFAGYGIDYLEKYRNLADLHAVDLSS